MCCKACNKKIEKGEHQLLPIGGGVSVVVCDDCFDANRGDSMNMQRVMINGGNA